MGFGEMWDREQGCLEKFAQMMTAKDRAVADEVQI